MTIAMTDVYVIRNQLGHYWGKGKSWVDGSDARAVLRVKHRDEAVNTLFELSAKDVELRGDILGVECDQRGHPVVEPSAVPLVEIALEAEPAPIESAPGETGSSDPGA